MPKKKFLVMIGVAFCLTLCSAWLGMQHTQSYDVHVQYERLCTWDCLLYAEIADNGYHFTLPPLPHLHSNVSFFPSFPLIARALHLATGLSGKTSVLLLSQFSSVVFWTLFFLILDTWGVSYLVTSALTLTILFQPATFFLVTGYSESTFLSGLLAMIYFHQCRKPLLSGISGFVMSAARIVGLPLALYPVIAKISQAGIDPRRWRNPWRPVIMAALGMLGACSFFFFCYLKWGYADLYMQNQMEGWGIVPNYLALFHPTQWRFASEYDRMSTFSIPLLIAVFITAELVVYFRWKDRRLNERIPFYFCILAMDYINISGLWARWFYSMVRYVLPCVILFTLAAAHLSRAVPRIPRLTRVFLFIIWAGLMAKLFYQVELPHYTDYVHYIWFA